MWSERRRAAVSLVTAAAALAIVALVSVAPEPCARDAELWEGWRCRLRWAAWERHSHHVVGSLQTVVDDVAVGVLPASTGSSSESAAVPASPAPARPLASSTPLPPSPAAPPPPSSGGQVYTWSAAGISSTLKVGWDGPLEAGKASSASGRAPLLFCNLDTGAAGATVEEVEAVAKHGRAQRPRRATDSDGAGVDVAASAATAEAWAAAAAAVGQPFAAALPALAAACADPTSPFYSSPLCRSGGEWPAHQMLLRRAAAAKAWRRAVSSPAAGGSTGEGGQEGEKVAAGTEGEWPASVLWPLPSVIDFPPPNPLQDTLAAASSLLTGSSMVTRFEALRDLTASAPKTTEGKVQLPRDPFAPLATNLEPGDGRGDASSSSSSLLQPWVSPLLTVSLTPATDAALSQPEKQLLQRAARRLCGALHADAEAHRAGSMAAAAAGWLRHGVGGQEASGPTAFDAAVAEVLGALDSGGSGDHASAASVCFREPANAAACAEALLQAAAGAGVETAGGGDVAASGAAPETSLPWPRLSGHSSGVALLWEVVLDVAASDATAAARHLPPGLAQAGRRGGSLKEGVSGLTEPLLAAAGLSLTEPVGTDAARRIAALGEALDAASSSSPDDWRFNDQPLPWLGAPEAYVLAITPEAEPLSVTSDNGPLHAAVASVSSETVWGAVRGLTTLRQALEPWGRANGRSNGGAALAAALNGAAVAQTEDPLLAAVVGTFRGAAAPPGAAGGSGAAPDTPSPRELLDPSLPLPVRLPLRIVDEPWRLWRGFSVDTARHFLPLPQLLATLDAMAEAKLNTLHWHIGDAQSWPLEVVTWPELTGAGSVNASAPAPRLDVDPPTRSTGAWSPGSVYTRSDVAGLIRAAADRGIRVVPELDMPSHAHGLSFGGPPAAFASCAGPASGSLHDWDKFALNPTSPEAWGLIAPLLLELKLRFPDPWMHLGADEVVAACWGADPGLAAWAASSLPAISGALKAGGVGTYPHSHSYIALLTHFLHRVTAITAGVLGADAMQWEDSFTILSGADGSRVGKVRGEVEAAKRAAAKAKKEREKAAAAAATNATDSDKSAGGGAARSLRGPAPPAAGPALHAAHVATLRAVSAHLHRTTRTAHSASRRLSDDSSASHPAADGGFGTPDASAPLPDTDTPLALPYNALLRAYAMDLPVAASAPLVAPCTEWLPSYLWSSFGPCRPTPAQPDKAPAAAAQPLRAGVEGWKAWEQHADGALVSGVTATDATVADALGLSVSSSAALFPVTASRPGLYSAGWYLDYSDPWPAFYRHVPLPENGGMMASFAGAWDYTVVTQEGGGGAGGYGSLPPPLSWPVPLLGGEAAVWLERIDASNVGCRVWPRAATAAEVLWSQRVLLQRWQAAGGGSSSGNQRTGWASKLADPGAWTTQLKQAAPRLQAFTERLWRLHASSARASPSSSAPLFASALAVWDVNDAAALFGPGGRAWQPSWWTPGPGKSLTAPADAATAVQEAAAQVKAGAVPACNGWCPGIAQTVQRPPGAGHLTPRSGSAPALRRTRFLVWNVDNGGGDGEAVEGGPQGQTRYEALLRWLRRGDVLPDVVGLVEAVGWTRKPASGNEGRRRVLLQYRDVAVAADAHAAEAAAWAAPVNASSSAATRSRALAPSSSDERFDDALGYQTSELRRRAAAAGFPHVLLGHSPSSYHVALLSSRAPIAPVAVQTMPQHFERGLIAGDIEGIRYLVAHLHAHDPVLRAQEAAWVASLVRSWEAAGIPVVLAGDFNSLSPLDAPCHGAALLDVLPYLANPDTPAYFRDKFTSVAPSSGARFLDYRPLATLLDPGAGGRLVDALVASGAGLPISAAGSAVAWPRPADEAPAEALAATGYFNGAQKLRPLQAVDAAPPPPLSSTPLKTGVDAAPNTPSGIFCPGTIPTAFETDATSHRVAQPPLRIDHVLVNRRLLTGTAAAAQTYAAAGPDAWALPPDDASARHFLTWVGGAVGRGLPGDGGLRCRVLNGTATIHLSDHFPLVCDLLLPQL